MAFEHTIAIIKNRRSIGKLQLPMPSIDDIKTILGVAMNAPDHKKLTPWRFVLLTDDKLNDFGQVLLQAGQQVASDKGETLDDNAKTKFVNMPKRAPMILVAISDYKDHPKVPYFEQDLAMGACIQNILLLLTAKNFQSVWRSGDLMNHTIVHKFFDVTAPNKIQGFIYIGSSDVVMPKRDELVADKFLTVY